MTADGQRWAIETTELTKQFGTFRALDRFSLTIARQSIFGLLGPNGAGTLFTWVGA